MSRLTALFARTRAEGRVALFPYLTAGYPDQASCEKLLLAAVAGGADGLEIGIPFSDPLADGVTLQRASQTALAGGASMTGAVELAGRLRRQTSVPLVFMTYANP